MSAGRRHRSVNHGFGLGVVCMDERAMLGYAVLSYAMLCYAMPKLYAYVMPRLRYALLCHAMLMPCYVMAAASRQTNGGWDGVVLSVAQGGANGSGREAGRRVRQPPVEGDCSCTIRDEEEEEGGE